LWGDLRGTRVSLGFLHFWAVLDPYFLGVFRGAFLTFFCPFKNDFWGFLTPMKTAPRTLGRSSTHRRLTSIPGNVLDFSGPKYQGFLAMIFGFRLATHFRAILLKAPVYKGFLQFRTCFGSPFSTRFFTSFFARA
jgi:hypothetical protein